MEAVLLVAAISITIGIVLMVLGIKNSKTALGILGAVVVVWSISIILFTVTHNGSALAKVLLGGMGTLFISLGIFMIKAVINCRERITGKYIDYEVSPGGKRRHGIPIFEYEYNGTSYSEKCQLFYGRLHIESWFKEGEEYEIYVNAKDPKKFVLYRCPKASSIIFLLLGIVLIGLVMWSIISPETMSLNIAI